MVYLELLTLFILTLFNGLLAMSELAMVSARSSRLEQMSRNGSRGARAALKLIANPSRFLSSVQIGITMVGIVAGVVSGATLGIRLGEWLNQFAMISPHGMKLGMGITVVGVTYGSVVFGELVPKRVALSSPERVAALVAIPMRTLATITTPFVVVLQFSTDLILRIFGLAQEQESTVTEEEVKSLIAEGTTAGVFEPQERKMLERVLSLADRPVRVIMRPRAELAWVSVHDELDQILEVVRSNVFSRLVVCDGTLDKPLGYIRAKDLIDPALNVSKDSLYDLITPLVIAHEDTSVLDLVALLKSSSVHMALVQDSAGTTEGLVTVTDLVEAIAGALPDHGVQRDPRILKLTDSSWILDGSLPTDEVEMATGIQMGNIMTVAAFVLEHLRTIPEKGASFEYNTAHFEVLEMSGRRISKVRVTISG